MTLKVEIKETSKATINVSFITTKQTTAAELKMMHWLNMPITQQRAQASFILDNSAKLKGLVK
jgi:hypothetical protein